MMLEIFKQCGLAGVIGFLLGLAAITVIGPTKPGGVAIIMLICIALCVGVGALYNLIRPSPKRKSTTE